MPTNNPAKPIVITAHARRRMQERGATEAEVVTTIREGTPEPAQRGLTLFRRNHSFHATWRGASYDIKQVACVIAREPDRLVVVSVYTFFFQERGQP